MLDGTRASTREAALICSHGEVFVGRSSLALLHHRLMPGGHRPSLSAVKWPMPNVISQIKLLQPFQLIWNKYMVFGSPCAVETCCRNKTDPIVLPGVPHLVADDEIGEMLNG